MVQLKDTSELRSVLAQLNRNCHFHNFDDVALFRLMHNESILQGAKMLPATAAQLRQDILAAVASGFKRDGYFVEIGATDGAYLSNTKLLEKELGWKGILAEPAKYWHKALHENRSAIIETRCVHSQTGQDLLFREVGADQALSTIVEFADGDFHHATREVGEDYIVGSISLTDLLTANDAPKDIDYLSLDTEGSEFEILKTFDFDAFQFGLISCEHNYTEARKSVLTLLKNNGYVRVLNGISQFDDWLVHNSRLASFEAAFPDWRDVSNQEDEGETRELSESDLAINALVIDRDAYKNALDKHMNVDLPEKEAAIQLLTETVESLIIDRDHHRDAYNTLKEDYANLKAKGWWTKSRK